MNVILLILFILMLIGSNETYDKCIELEKENAILRELLKRK